MALDPNQVNLDPQAKALLAFLAQAGRIPYSQITPPLARAQYVELCRRTRKADAWAVDAADHTLAGPGGALRARLYRPRGAATAPLPALLYFHGGGWCIGDIDTHDAACRQLAQQAQCAVLSLDYRLAPEHRFPAAVEDSSQRSNSRRARGGASASIRRVSPSAATAPAAISPRSPRCSRATPVSLSRAKC